MFHVKHFGAQEREKICMDKVLKKYCLTVCCINGLDTYIISPVQYDNLISDEELLKKFDFYRLDDYVINLIQIARKVDTDMLYLSFVQHKNFGTKYQWEPLLCYRHDNIFYHVAYRSSWMCRECKHILYAPVIMPKDEEDSAFYSGTEKQFPDIPPLFQKVSCPECGRLLQNHLIILREDVHDFCMVNRRSER